MEDTAKITRDALTKTSNFLSATDDKFQITNKTAEIGAILENGFKKIFVAGKF